MGLVDFIKKQFIDVIEWNEPADGILSYRYPMQDLEIQNGGQLRISDTLLLGLQSTFREKLEWLEEAETLTLQLRASREQARTRKPRS